MHYRANGEINMLNQIRDLVDNYLMHLRVERHLAANTLESYSRDLGFFLDFLKTQNVAEIEAIKEHHILGFLIVLHKKKISSRSVARYLSSMRSLFRFLIIEKKVKPGNQVLVDFDGQDFVFNIEKTEIVTGVSDKASQAKKKYLCESCANKFITEIVLNSTLICSKCASHEISEVFDECLDVSSFEKQKEKKEELKTPNLNSDMQTPVDQTAQQSVAV